MRESKFLKGKKGQGINYALDFYRETMQFQQMSE